MVEHIKAGMLAGGTRRMSNLSNMIHLKESLKFLQQSFEDVVAGRLETLAERAAQNPKAKAINTTKGDFFELTRTPSIIKGAFDTALFTLGRIVPEWHEMFVHAP